MNYCNKINLHSKKKDINLKEKHSFQKYRKGQLFYWHLSVFQDVIDSIKIAFVKTLNRGAESISSASSSNYDYRQKLYQQVRNSLIWLFTWQTSNGIIRGVFSDVFSKTRHEHF